MSDPDFRPPSGKGSAWTLPVAALAVAAAAGGGWWYWQQREGERPAATPDTVASAPAAAPAPVEALPVPAAAPAGPAFPVAPASADAAPLPALAESDPALAAALGGWLGQRSVRDFLQVDGFVRRVVATVDALPREQAASRLWPVQPSPGRFTVAGQGDAQRIADGNAARYAPFVQFVEAVDPARAVDLYRRFYPLFQQAYEELGYPKQYFNDRLVVAIDHLLAAPEPAVLPMVRLTEVRGEVPSTRPWVRYEFADPALQTLSAGQKAMVRVGLDQERRLKRRLQAFRAALLAAPVAR